MAKYRKWTVKASHEPKQYRTAMGTTDYDIPMFGYKSIAFVIIVIVLSMFIIPTISGWFQQDYRWPFVTFGSPIAGFAIAYAQFFINSKKGYSSGFWLIGLIWTLVVGLIYYLLVMNGIIL